MAKYAGFTLGALTVLT